MVRNKPKSFGREKLVVDTHLILMKTNHDQKEFLQNNERAILAPNVTRPVFPAH